MQIGILSDAQHALLRRAFVLSNHYVVSTITAECAHTQGGWYDTRPMLDEREHAPASVDTFREILQYGIDAGLLERHAADRAMVRVRHNGGLKL